MSAGEPFDQAGEARAGALQVVVAAEKAVLEATARCNPENREELRLVERFLGIARRRLLLQDWKGARLFGRMAVECAGRVVPAKGTTPSAPDHSDPLR